MARLAIVCMAASALVASAAAAAWGGEQEAKQVRREFSGVSENRDFGEALADALRQMDEAVSKLAKHPCSHVSWRVADIHGESGTPADLKRIRVKISASFEVGEAEQAPAATDLLGTWTFEHGALGEFDRLELNANGTFAFEHRDVALGTTTTSGEWRHTNGVLVLRPAQRDGQAVREPRTPTETLRAIQKDGQLVLEGKGRLLRKVKEQP